jgi:hypothetical protein
MPMRNKWIFKQINQHIKPSKWWQLGCEEKGNCMGVKTLVHDDDNVITKNKNIFLL